MNKEIKLRKRRFWAICFVIFFAMIQSIPSSVLAAEIYSTNELTPGTTVLHPGDVINYRHCLAVGGRSDIYYCNDDATKSEIDSEYYENNNDPFASSDESFTVKDYTGTALSAEEFKEWKVDEIYTSSGVLGYIRLVAVGYTKSTINYVLDGGTNAELNPNFYYEEKAEVVLEDAEKEGCTFEGWYEDAGFTTRVTSIPTTQTGSLTLYAKFTANNYNIFYELDGGSNGEGNPDSYTYGIGVASFADAEKEGHTFEGWYADAEFTTQITSIDATQIGDVTLHAKFVEDDIHVTAPSITTQPGNATVKVGETATFTLAASGTALTYQWQIDKNDGNGWVNIAGANEASYTTSTVNISCSGFKYQCVVSNSAGTVTSNTAVLTVTENIIPDPVDYEILDGASSNWEQNSDGSLSIRGSGALSKFVGVKVDGTLVDAKNYTVKEGSTIVTLKADYLNTLSVGTHTFEILWTDGSAITTFTIKANTSDNSNNNQNDNNNSDSSDDKPSSGTDKKDDVAKTGDNTPIVWLFILSILSGTGLIITVKKRRENLNS